MTVFAHVQSVSKDDSANSSTTHTITITSSTANSVIKVAVRIPASSDTTVAGTDNKSQTYTEKNHNFISGFGLFSELYFLNTVAAVTTITITLGTALGARIIAEEYSCTAGNTAAFDGTPVNANVAASTTINSGNEVAGGADVLLLSSFGGNAAGYTPTLPSSPAAWTKGSDIPASGGKLVTAYLLGQGAGTYSATWGAGISDDLYGSIAVVKATGGGTSENLTAQTITSSEGTATRSVTVALTAQTVTFTEGTISASTGGNVTLSLTGQSASFSEGVLSANIGYVLNDGIGLGGQVATFAEGAPTESISYALTAQTVTASEGSPTRAVNVFLTGQTASFAEGIISPSVPGNVSRLLTGITCVSTAGVISATNTGTGLIMPNVVGLNYYEALLVLQEAGIYLPVSVISFGASQISIQWAKSAYPGGTVSGQSLIVGHSVTAGQALTLTISTFPLGSMIDSPPDWKQLT